MFSRFLLHLGKSNSVDSASCPIVEADENDITNGDEEGEKKEEEEEDSGNISGGNTAEGDEDEDGVEPLKLSEKEAKILR